MTAVTDLVMGAMKPKENEMAVYSYDNVTVKGVCYECQYVRNAAIPGNETDPPEKECLEDVGIFLTDADGKKVDMREFLEAWLIEEIEEKLLEADK
jgi:hypothetical protein